MHERASQIPGSRRRVFEILEQRPMRPMRVTSDLILLLILTNIRWKNGNTFRAWVISFTEIAVLRRSALAAVSGKLVTSG